MTALQASDNIATFFQHLQSNRWRCLYCMQGNSAWLERKLNELFVNPAAKLSVIVFSNLLALQQARQKNTMAQYLGKEYQYVVIDCREDFDANQFCLAAGLVKAGGALVLLLPEHNDSLISSNALISYSISTDIAHAKQRQANFYSRLINMIHKADGVVIQTSNKTTINSYAATKQIKSNADHGLSEQFIEQQQAAVLAIVRCARGHAKRPVVLMAQRGRGKSAALGIAAAKLLAQGKTNIIVSAPSWQQVQAVFKHALQHLDGAIHEHMLLRWQSAQITFIAIDELLLNPVKADLLMIDEAAMLPVQQLLALSKRFSRMVFATTNYGYEGSGTGFTLRFLPTLKKIMNSVITISIDSPARWNTDDYLENITNTSCLLDAKLTDYPVQDTQTFALDTLTFKQFDIDYLLKNEDYLVQIYALLMHAHYRTSPRDLQQLLDAPELTCFGLTSHDRLVAVAIVLDEGKLDQCVSQQIAENTRRVAGHLLIQQLINETAHAQHGSLRCARIMRIAVDPALQGKGIGSLLLATIKSTLLAKQYDLWGTSFGAQAQLVNFWTKNSFSMFRLGHKRQHSSGEYNISWLSALQQQHQPLVKNLNQYFIKQLSTQLLHHKRYDVEVIYAIFYANSQTFTMVEEGVIWRVERATNKQLEFSRAYYPLLQWTCFISQHLQYFQIEKQRLLLLIEYFLLHGDVKLLCTRYQIVGRASLENELLEILMIALQQYQNLKKQEI